MRERLHRALASPGRSPRERKFSMARENRASPSLYRFWYSATVPPVAPPVAVKVADGHPDLVVRLVDQCGDLEPRDVGILQDGRERFGVVRRSGQPPQSGVLVVVGGDQQRQSTSHD
jgi:hypothetical protein